MYNAHTALTAPCRLCGHLSEQRFNLHVLKKHTVAYFQCTACDSLQTQTPYWLEEAYGANNLSNLDTGAAQRNVRNLSACYTIARLFDAKTAIDVGGGDGLLCRLLRDYNLDCYVKDKYAAPTYAQGFTAPTFETPDIVFAFEVLEHYPNPKTDLKDIFDYQSNVVLVSTAPYANESSDWWYLAPESGQHVFFYSKKALQEIAQTYNYDVLLSGGFILFVKKPLLSRFKKLLATLLLKAKVNRLLLAFLVLLPFPGAERDHQAQRHNLQPVDNTSKQGSVS